MAPIVAAIGIGATIAGGVVEAEGARKSGEVQKQIYDYQAAVAYENAKYFRMQGEREAVYAGMRSRAEAGQIAAAQGASMLTGESQRQVRESQQALGRLRQEDIRTAAARRAFGEETQAKLDIAAGEQAQWAGKVKRLSTYLGTAAQVATVSAKWMQAGGGGPGSFDTGMGLSPFGGSRYFG